jgi:protein-tyrosine phosphatase
MARTIRICFVCLGNICRSPTAEGIMRRAVREAGLEGKIAVASAGTGDWHVGDAADARSRETAARRGVILDGTAKQFLRADFGRFDHVLAMDAENLRVLARLAPDETARKKVRLFRDVDPESPRGAAVPDPYYGGAGGFDEVFDICERACRALLAELRREHGL